MKIAERKLVRLPVHLSNSARSAARCVADQGRPRASRKIASSGRVRAPPGFYITRGHRGALHGLLGCHSRLLGHRGAFGRGRNGLHASAKLAAVLSVVGLLFAFGLKLDPQLGPYCLHHKRQLVEAAPRQRVRRVVLEDAVFAGVDRLEVRISCQEICQCRALPFDLAFCGHSREFLYHHKPLRDLYNLNTSLFWFRGCFCECFG
mmetsp:Transcript_32411/g.65498  ORF Transcript_32411/g.65498 Transcript_32411/m.65498 type:complete len:205 (+) Transcript_32411:100-714(+)